LSETMLAMLVALGKGLELVVSHRSKSPNDDMEAQIALAANALGLKTGGGSNTERLFKYGAVTKIMKDMLRNKDRVFEKKDASHIGNFVNDLVITDIIAYEEPTNAGIPTVGVEVYAGLKDNRKYRKLLKTTGATPLGTSAGMGEAIHLVDSIIEKSAIIDKYTELFAEQSDKTFLFQKGITEHDIMQKKDSELAEIWSKTQRYNGKGCQNAVSNVVDIIAKEFLGKKLSELNSMVKIDRTLLMLERKTAIQRGKLSSNVDGEDLVEVLQRKANLGMNAVLSVSLSIARMIAHVQGKDLWQLLREEMKQTVARAIMAHGGLDLISNGLAKEKLQQLQGSKDRSWRLLYDNLTFDDLIMGLQKVEEKAKNENIKLYQVLREQMQVYTDRK